MSQFQPMSPDSPLICMAATEDSMPVYIVIAHEIVPTMKIPHTYIYLCCLYFTASLSEHDRKVVISIRNSACGDAFCPMHALCMRFFAPPPAKAPQVIGSHN